MKKRWRCFYCDEVFTRAVDALEHFGGFQGSLAGCQIKGYEGNLLAEIRRQESLLASYRSDDSDIMRALQSLQCEVEERVRRAEELGCNRGKGGRLVA